MDDRDIKFARYLIREFFWELSQHEPLPVEFAGAQQESVEVLSFRGYHDLRVRVAAGVFDVHLTWKKLEPPIIQRVEHAAA
jgi:hypothetical protein